MPIPSAEALVAINLFIDTNIFLSFFHLASDDLEELKKLQALLTNDKIRLYLPDQVLEEFRRNRESKIANGMTKMREQKLNLQFPQICKDYPEYKEVRALQKDYDEAHKKLLEKVGYDIQSESLKADALIKKLFKAGESIATSDDLLERARRRKDIGNPPGKSRSLGDAINWEALLGQVPDGEPLHFIADDKDYASPLNQSDFNKFLLAEWRDRKLSKLISYKRLSEFFRENFPDIKLARDVAKDLLIAQLAHSPNFAATHATIALLAQHADFTAAQANAIVSAATCNSQIHWIMSDYDVKEFIESVIKSNEDQIEPDNLETLQKLLSPDDAEKDDFPF